MCHITSLLISDCIMGFLPTQSTNMVDTDFTTEKTCRLDNVSPEVDGIRYGKCDHLEQECY